MQDVLPGIEEIVRLVFVQIIVKLILSNHIVLFLTDRTVK